MVITVPSFSSPSPSTLLTNLLNSQNDIPLPKCIVFDLDNTLWNRPRFKKGGQPFTPINDGLNGIHGTNGEILDLFPASRDTLRILNDYHNSVGSNNDKEQSSGSISISLVSRTHRPQWSKEFINTLKVDQTRTVADCIVDPKNNIIIRDGSKKLHVKEISQKMGIQPRDMLFFDDRKKDVMEVMELGAVAVLCPYGLMMDDVELGFSLYANRMN